MDQHTLDVPPCGSFAVSKQITSKPRRPAARQTHSHCLDGPETSSEWQSRPRRVFGTRSPRIEVITRSHSTPLLQIEVQPQRILESGESLHPDLADRFSIQTPNRYRTHLLRLRFRRSRQT